MADYDKQIDGAIPGDAAQMSEEGAKHSSRVGGLLALMQPRFGLRMAEWFCAMVSFSCIGGATDVNEAHPTLAKFADGAVTAESCTVGPCGMDGGADTCELSVNCPQLSAYSGEWDFSPYRFAIATGVFIWMYTMLTMVMSLHKKEKGTRFLFVLPGWVLEKYIKNKGFIEFVVDMVLIIFAIFAIMASAIDVEVEAEFTREFNCEGFEDPCTEVSWFTISTFYSTFESRGYPLKPNPASRIRAGIAFMFFCFFMLTYSAISSYRQWKHDETKTLSVGETPVSEGSEDATMVAAPATHRGSAI